jgi:hypothetical protein
MPKPRKDPYRSPYTAVILVDGKLFQLTERSKAGFRAVRLRGAVARWVQDELDNAHANIEAHLGGAPDR